MRRNAVVYLCRAFSFPHHKKRTMTINDMQDQLMADFQGFRNNEEIAAYLQEAGRELPGMDSGSRNDHHLVTGWPYPLWLQASCNNGRVWFRAHSSHPLTRALTHLLIKVLNGQSPRDIANADIYFIQETRLLRQLAPELSTQWPVIVKKMKSLAVFYQLELLQRGSFDYCLS
jgi:cysteine desulfuration protein SufE